MIPFDTSTDYLSSDQRFKQGERSLIITSPVVGQKSYNKEKRFLCPPPAAYIIGPAWFDPLVHPQDHANYIQKKPSFRLDARLEPPKIQLSISGESPPAGKHTAVRWTSIEAEVWPNELFGSDQHTDSVPPDFLGPHRTNEPPLYGYAIDRTLYLTEGITHSGPVGNTVEKNKPKRVIRTQVSITAPPVLPGVPGVHIGTFEGKEIKLVSKPVRKKPGVSLTSGGNSKTVDITLTHGSLLSLFQRHRSQASLTRYLSISDSASWMRATDGSSLCSDEGLWRREQRNNFYPILFTAKPDMWTAFIVWKINTRDLSHEASNFSMPEPDWPAPPENAIPFDPSKPKPIRYNNTIILQCPQSGALSPILVVRRSIDAGCVVGGDAEDEQYGEEERMCCPPGEGPGDLVTQLQKVALEVYSPSRARLAPGSFGSSGSFFAVHEDRIQTDQPQTNRLGFSERLDAIDQRTARWFVQIEDRALWSVVNVERVRHTFCIPRIPVGPVEGGRQLGLLDGPVNPLPKILRVQPLRPSESTHWIEHRGFKAELVVAEGEKPRDMAVVYGIDFQKLPDSSFSLYNLMFGTMPSPRTELRCEEVLVAVIPDKISSEMSFHQHQILDQAQGDVWMDVNKDQEDHARQQKDGKRQLMLSLVRKSDGLIAVSQVVYMA